jgi:geranylgeranyl diphosphate synthase type I
MTLDQLIQKYLPAIENELQNTIKRVDGNRYDILHHMMAYHMGWVDEGAGEGAGGKRIRPLLVLMTTAAAGGKWESALPAAASIELIHNFSLLHDDIEDNSPLRRGRQTIWVKWGVPQAINTGDAMFSLAHITMLRLEATTSLSIALEAAKIIQNTCLLLTKGQFLDISYEGRVDLTIDDYWPMVTGKTAALIATCTEIGALIAGADEKTCCHYQVFGQNLGLAFQALDDFLGIWGDSAKIGKSNASDLVTGKKSLPVLYGLAQGGVFSARWIKGPITPREVPDLARQLELEGAKHYTQQIADQLTSAALEALEKANPKGDAGQALTLLAKRLLRRQV